MHPDQPTKLNPVNAYKLLWQVTCLWKNYFSFLLLYPNLQLWFFTLVMFITNINIIFPILIIHMIDVKITFFISVIHIIDIKKKLY